MISRAAHCRLLCAVCDMYSVLDALVQHGTGLTHQLFDIVNLSGRQGPAAPYCHAQPPGDFACCLAKPP